MNYIRSTTQSIHQLMQTVNSPVKHLLLPEFQRDFVWSIEQSYTLRDSIFTGIFIGELKFGVPQFGMTLREFDTRPRRGKGSRDPIERHNYSTEEILAAYQRDHLNLLLDGQQRVTTIVRTLSGVDRMYFTAREDIVDLDVNALSLEALIHPDERIQGEDLDHLICVPLDYAYRYTVENPFDDEVRAYFATQTRCGRQLVRLGKEVELQAAFRVFRQLLPHFKTLFEEPRLLTSYTLDMNLDKSVTFFERSNAEGLKLNFTDILGAKVFEHFRLRRALELLSAQHPGMPIKRELLVRAVAVMTGRFNRIEKSNILKELDGQDFQEHWDTTVELYVQALDYLQSQRLLISPKWLPTDNLLIPLMMYFNERRKLRRKSLPQEQQQFLHWWYWSSVFGEHFSRASNEAIMAHTRILQRVARGESVENSFYFRLRPVITEPEQLYNYASSTSGIYRGVLNLVHFAGGGLRHWSNDGPLSATVAGGLELQDHHVFPRSFVNRTETQQDVPAEVQHLRDSVVNRVLMPRDINLRASDQPPAVYLRQLLESNPALEASLRSHLIDPALIHDEGLGHRMHAVLRARAVHLVALIRRETLDAEVQVRARFSPERLVAGD